MAHVLHPQFEDGGREKIDVTMRWTHENEQQALVELSTLSQARL